jgi:exonuclease VII large subunit
MAEIKSTMEMVLERAARMAESAPEVTENDDLVKTGMKLAADYLKTEGVDLKADLGSHTPADQAEIIKGMAQTLLRNIVLPRDEQLESSGQAALQGILNLSTNSGEIQTICQELAQILAQYGQHQEQSIVQLKDALKAQIQQQQMSMGQETQEDINPAMHPQYNEELGKMMTSLNNQYNDAMNQRKEMILQLFSQQV